MDDDTSWHGLVGSLVDSDARVSSMARIMLDGLAAPEMDPVEWTGARTHWSALLDGTNPWVFSDILHVLVGRVHFRRLRDAPCLDYLSAHRRFPKEPRP